MFKKIAGFSLICCLLLSIPLHAGAEKKGPRKNVIFMVMDGTNSDVITLARHFKGEPLALDEILTGGVRTYSLRSAITDSAAAATAMATGHKTTMDFIGMVPYQAQDGTVGGRPVANILEAAQEKGLATGLIATAPVQHATPAAFSAHSISRHRLEEIGWQQAHQNIDLILGGGKRYAFSASDKQGNAIRTQKDLLQSDSLPLYGYFADEDLAYELDRKVLHPEQPSLAEMTKKALRLLSQDHNGFFLFIEGSKVDFAGHKNDPVGMISEILAFDASVQEALTFAKEDQQTLLIAVADHGNGGLTMGNNRTDKTYPDTSPDHFVAPLKKAKYTVTGALSQLKPDRSNLKEVLNSYGLDGVSPQELVKLKNGQNIEQTMVQMMARRANLGFTTKGHSGEDVSLYSYGGAGVEHHPTGLLNNTELAEYVVKHLQLPSLAKLTDEKFVSAQEHFESKGFRTKIQKGDIGQPVFIAEKAGLTIQYPANQNIRYVNGKKETVNGVVVFNGMTFWIPMDKEQQDSWTPVSPNYAGI
ncbi:alkaline phosphatase [Siminovitchia sediminis]|uniref:Alkaline phosphatase n=1 Tax=Siminovitchia sediminis TaxID=1274353 RepID=A0ABW4KIG7_9BACI